MASPYGAALVSSALVATVIVGTACYTVEALSQIVIKGEKVDSEWYLFGGVGVAGLTTFVISKLVSPVFGIPLDAVCLGLSLLSVAPTLIIIIGDCGKRSQERCIYQGLWGPHGLLS